MGPHHTAAFTLLARIADEAADARSPRLLDALAAAAVVRYYSGEESQRQRIEALLSHMPDSAAGGAACLGTGRLRPHRRRSVPRPGAAAADHRGQGRRRIPDRARHRGVAPRPDLPRRRHLRRGVPDVGRP
ncbi:hypothetical protein LV779_23670 [Streptomyces thinghirensis]|nr:hypothetical protein [Streptomyces thinghirensis]